MKAPRNYKDGRETSPPDVKNEEIAARFSEIADMLDILCEDTFRSLSYQRAARQLESLTENVEDLVREGRVDQIQESAARLPRRSRSTSRRVGSHTMTNYAPSSLPA